MSKHEDKMKVHEYLQKDATEDSFELMFEMSRNCGTIHKVEETYSMDTDTVHEEFKAALFSTKLTNYEVWTTMTFVGVAIDKNQHNTTLNKTLCDCILLAMVLHSTKPEAANAICE